MSNELDFKFILTDPNCNTLHISDFELRWIGVDNMSRKYVSKSS